MGLAQLVEQRVDECIAIGDQADIEIEEEGGAGAIRKRRELGQRRVATICSRPRAGWSRPPDPEVERAFEADAVMAAHQALMAEDCAGANLDDRLEGVFDDELGERHKLVTGEAAQRSEILSHPADMTQYSNIHLFLWAEMCRANRQQRLSPV